MPQRCLQQNLRSVGMIFTLVSATLCSGTVSGQSSPMQATLDIEAEEVSRLNQILKEHYSTGEDADAVAVEEPVIEEEPRDSEPEEITYSADQILLSGSEGDMLLTHISQRLKDFSIPSSRRDVAPICIIDARRSVHCLDSKRRSLAPLGKQQFIVTEVLQGGDITISINTMKWDFNLPEQASETEYVITYYQPPGGQAELHVFAVAEWLAVANPHHPEWLPSELANKIEQE